MIQRNKNGITIEMILGTQIHAIYFAGGTYASY